MYYRYKKRLLRVIYYLTSLVGIGYLYIEAAHRRLLPAVFEYYTGDLVRSRTAELYGAAAFRPGDTTSASPRYASNWHNVLDTLTREPGYLAAMNLLEHNLKVWENLPRNINRKELLLAMGSDATLVQWLRNPKSRFADVYQYEFLYRMDSYRYISGYRIMDNMGRDLYRSRAFDDTAVPATTEKLALEKKGFSIPITDESRLLGYLQGNWDPAWFPDLPTLAANQAGFLSFTLTSAGFVISPDIGYEDLESYLTEIDNRKKYQGPLSGRLDGRRFVSATIDGLTMVVVFKAASWTFYLFQILLYMAAGVVAWLSYAIIARLSAHLRKQPLVRRSVWLEEDLKSSYALQQNSLELLNESARYLSDIRRREADSIAWIAARLTSLSPLPVAEPAKVSSKTAVVEPIINQTEDQTPLSQSTPAQPENTLYRAPTLPEPEILDAGADDSIVVIDEMSPAAPKEPVGMDEPWPAVPIAAENQPAPKGEPDSATYHDDLEQMFADIFGDISAELDEETFGELLGSLDTAPPVQAPEKLSVGESLVIVDEEPQDSTPVASSAEMKPSIVSFIENLEQDNWELMENQSPWELHDDEDFEILGIHGPPALLDVPAPQPAVSEPVSTTADELVLFEDDDIEDLLAPPPARSQPAVTLLSAATPLANTEPVAESELKGDARQAGSFQYRIKPEILSFEPKEKPLVIREKLDPQQTILVLAEDEK